MTGSNCRPSPCKGDALPTELITLAVLKVILLLVMAGVTGLEPAASCVTGMRSNQLSYTP